MAPSTVDQINTALITGGGGGIGKALAKHLISHGKKVIIAGRTESTLQKTAKEIGATAYYVLDTGDVASMPSFIKKITSEHPDLNCLVNNAGVQRPFQFPGSGKDDNTFDLQKADQEIDINIRGPMHLCVGLLPHFTSLPDGQKSVIVNISSVLGYNPSSIINPVYNGTKAWIHMFTLNMRTQLADSGKVKIVEIVPPTVSTELHRERKDPNDNSKESTGGKALSLDEFMDDVKEGFSAGKDVIAPGPAGDVVKAGKDLQRLYEEATG